VLSLETLFLPNPHLLLPLSQVVQDECLPPTHTLCSKQWASFFSESERDPCIPGDRHMKVLLYNLGLTVFVKHLIKLVKQVLQSPLMGKKRVKGTETSTVFSIFVPFFP
jgi:hypothetical protein